MSTEAVIDPEIASEVKAILAEHLDKRFADFDTKMERRAKELAARAPGALTGFAPATRSLPLLGGDQKFHDFLRQSRARSSKFVGTFSDFHIEQKAVGTIVSPGITTPMPGILASPEMALRLVELLPTVSLFSGGGVEYVREATFVPGADIQAVEGDLKAFTSIEIEPKTATIKTIATWIKASLQALADTPGLVAFLDGRLRYSVQLRAEAYLLNAAAPDGLLASATAADLAFAPSTGANALDTIGAAIGQLAASGFTPDGVVMSGSDVAKMRLLKNDVGDYLWISPKGPMGAATVFAVPLVISPSMAAGTFLVGAFGQSCILFSRQTLVVDIAYENEDDFLRNLCAIRAEERIANAVPVPAGLVKGTLPAGLPLAAAASKK